MSLNKMLMIAALAAIPLAIVDVAEAQGHKPGKQQKADRRADGQDRPSILADATSKNGEGPAFCRSGAGHPVHGRTWCIEKGFGIGTDKWGRARWGDILLGRSGRDQTRVMSSGTLSDILGRIVFGRLQSQARALGGGSLNGQWIDTGEGPLVLQVQAGSRPLAEFVDRNRDGRAEIVLLNLGR